MKYVILILLLGNIAQAGFNEDLSLQTYQGDDPFMYVSGAVKYSFPKSNFAIEGSALYGMYHLDTDASTSDWAYSAGVTYNIGKHLVVNADYVYKTINQDFMVYELENSPSMMRFGMTLHF